MMRNTLVRWLALCLLGLCGSLPLQTLAQSSAIGTVEGINTDEGWVLVSGQRLPYQEGTVPLQWRERQVSMTWLQPGVRIRYELDANGNITRLELLGPVQFLERIDRH